MSPTPEQLLEIRRTYAEKNAKEEAIQKRLSELNKAIESVGKRCCEIVGNENHKDDCNLVGYLLDKTWEKVSLHPIIIKVLAPGGAVTDYYYLMVGGNFSESLEIADPNFTQVNKLACKCNHVLINDHRGWQERYPFGKHFIYHDNQLGIAHDDSSYFPRGIVDVNSLVKNDADFDEVIRIKEAMVVALANAAGIEATDEKSDDFSLLLEQLKKIEEEKGK